MNELIEKESTALTEPEGSWGCEGASKQDILIPRIQLMQDLSELVKQQKAKPGDIVNSTTKEVLASEGEPIEIIPLKTFREWEISTVDGKNRSKFLQKVLVTPDNENWPKEGVQDGMPIRRVKALNFFVIVVKNKEELPCIISFKKFSTYPGRQLSTHFQMAAMRKEPVAATVFNLASQSKSWEGYTFKIFTIEKTRAATPEERALAKNWYMMLSNTKVEAEEEFPSME